MAHLVAAIAAGGGGSTGGHVAVPIFEPVIRAVWAHAASKAALAPPSPEAKSQLACKSVDLESGEAQSGRGKVFSECFRVDRKGKVIDTAYRLMSQEAHAKRDREDGAARKNEASAGRKREASAPRSGSAPAPNFDNAWSRQPWGAQQQWGWQGGSAQQSGEERREWRPSW